jgi:polyphosphate kinase
MTPQNADSSLTEEAPQLDNSNYINRELSWIEFNRRVLEQAVDESLPLLERLKFLAIVSSNMDEFFMVRVASVHSKVKAGLPTTRPDGIPNPTVLEEIRRRTLPLMRRQREIMAEVLAKLAQQGITIYAVEQLDKELRAAIRQCFYEEIFPVLTPLAVDAARPFPFISNLSLNLAVILVRKRGGADSREFVRLKIPDNTLPRLMNLHDVARKYGGTAPDGFGYLWLEDVIAANLDLLFPGMKVLNHIPFRITRNADIDYEFELEPTHSDVSDLIEDKLDERQFGSVVRLSVPDSIDDATLDVLIRRLEVDPERDVYRVNGALGGASLMQLTGIDKPELKDVPYLPRVPKQLIDVPNIFNAIRQRDHLLHHPYDSFSPVEAFFQQAAHDPDVLAIKATLYRVGRRSPIVQALMEAREEDKQVTVLVELKARFDEENNLEWARKLDNIGVHVVFGVEELPVKTHAKIALVVRRDEDGVRRYVHLSTGNYNSGTARLYTDIGMFTCDREIADDASHLFNRLTGFAPGTTYKRLLVAPEYVLPRLLELIDNEIEAAKQGKPARLIFKMNQLEEDVMIAKLYQASRAGVQIDLLVRGICCLRPGIPGMSEHIRVRSIVGRFLEHSRIFYFHNAPHDQRLYLGSADLMRRNLYNRVEVVFPILESRLQKQVLRILATSLKDNVKAWSLGSDDLYTPIQPQPGERLIDSQAIFMDDSFGLDMLP